MFLTGPAVVREVMGEDTSVGQLGGPKVHERNGVCHFTAADDTEAILAVRRLLGLLPQNAWTPVPRRPAMPPEPGDPGEPVPGDPRRAYDVRDVARRLVDGGELVESARRWAPNLVTALARIEGRAVGIVANQPKHLAGVLDADAAQKGARFVQTCNAFGIPLIVLVDTPGFMPGRAQESAGVIRHGAKLLHAFASATVPRLTVVLRKAFGGAYISMNAKDLGAHLTLAWPTAEIGIMGARQAVGVLHRRRLRDAPDPATAMEELAAEYAEEHLNATAAARDGFIDELVEPAHTRERLRWALEAMKDQKGGEGVGGNIPL
jgi:acetyl-CoA carboxylase carboxyltransferase component